MGDIKQRIIDFYKPELKDTFIYLHVNGERKFIYALDDKRLFLTFGVGAKNAEEAIENGAYETTGMKLTELLFPDEFAQIKAKYLSYPYVMDERTKSYLDAIKNKIGLLETKAGWDEETFDPVIQYDIWINLTGSGYVDVGQLHDGRWIAQFAFRTDIDDYCIVRYYFNRKPSRKDIITVKTIEDIEGYLSLRGYDKVEFECWECGQKAHFCDIPADTLEEKFEFFKERYCNRC